MARTPDWMPTTHAEAKRLLGDRDARKIGNNTYVERITMTTDDLAVRYHGTHIVTFYADGAVTLNTGGYSTTTTKARLAVVAYAHGWRLSQKDYAWSLEHVRTGTRVEFHDGENVAALSASLGLQAATA